MKHMIAVLAIIAPVAAIAGEQEAQECAAALSPEAKQIYDAVAPKVEADSDLRSLMRREVRPMVENGDLTRQQARSNAPAAGACLVKLKG